MKLNLFLKIATGIFIVPAAIILHLMWPWWENKNTKLWKRAIVAPFVIPAWVMLYLVSAWYEEIYKV